MFIYVSFLSFVCPYKQIIIIVIIIIIIIIIEFLTSQLWLGNIPLSCDVVINRIRLGGLTCNLKSFLQLNMCQELQIFAVVYVYVFGCKLSLVRLWDSDFEITPVDDITIGITFAAFCFHITHISFASSWHLFCLSVIVLAKLCVFGTAMPIKKLFFVFLFIKVMSGRLKDIVLSVSMLRFQLEIFILQHTGWCVLIICTSLFSQFRCFCQFLMDNFG